MKAIKDILKKLNYIMNRKQKQQYVFVTAIALIGSIWELLGVSSLLPFIQTIMPPEEARKEWYVTFFSDGFKWIRRSR